MFELIIGLEVHVQLNTNTKLFCSCSTNFGDNPNTNTCPTCLGLPGSLPVLNKEAVKKAILFGKAVEAVINNNSIFERKNYFYPDLPTSYQISQLQRPIVQGGTIIVDTEDGLFKVIKLDRAHLECDAGKNTHLSDCSMIDLNRAGTPLLEIVTQPDFRNSFEVISYLKQLHQIVRYTDISDANMENGNFRCDVNISIRPKGDKNLYTRCEIKNINSFKFIEQAISYEFNRHVEAWEDGVYEEEIFQETRLFDPEKGITKSMRGKEEAMDYRYFPDPDLKPVFISNEMYEECKLEVELPRAKKLRYREIGVSEMDIERIINDLEVCYVFDYFLDSQFKLKTIITWVVNEWGSRIKNEDYLNAKTPITLTDLGSIMEMIEDNKINKQGGIAILDYITTKRECVDSVFVLNIANELDLLQDNNSDELLKIVKEVLMEQSSNVEEYKNGKTKLLGSFVGQVMKKTGGKANPKLANELILQEIGV